jgi:hypothetical protein
MNADVAMFATADSYGFKRNDASRGENRFHESRLSSSRPTCRIVKDPNIEFSFTRKCISSEVAPPQVICNPLLEIQFCFGDRIAFPRRHDRTQQEITYLNARRCLGVSDYDAVNWPKRASENLCERVVRDDFNDFRCFFIPRMDWIRPHTKGLLTMRMRFDARPNLIG